MSEHPASDDIDLLELVEVIWAGKYLIASITAFVSILTVIALMNWPTKYDISLTIRPLSQQQMSAYAPLNDVPGISPPIYAGEILIGQTGVISSESLEAEFIGAFRSGGLLQKAIQAHNPAFIDFTGTDQEKADALVRAAAEFTLETDEDKTSFILSTNADNPEMVREIFDGLVLNAREAIRKDNLITIANLSRSIENSLAYEIVELRRTIENDRQLYRDNLKVRIANLSEQAKIARALGIERPTNQTTITTSVTTANNDDANRNRDSKLFMRGYKALETEAKLLKNRGPDEWRNFTPSYPENAKRLRELQNDKRLDRIETGLALSPLSDAENFTPVNFDTDNILITPSTNKILFLLITVFLAGLIGSLVVLFRHFSLQRKAIGLS